MTDDEIMAFRAELLVDVWARGTDAPHLCTRALASARGTRQKQAKAKARNQVLSAYNTWLDSGRDGVTATALSLNRASI